MIFKKPFDSVELLRMARALTEKWELGQIAYPRLDHRSSSPPNVVFYKKSVPHKLRDLMNSLFFRTAPMLALACLLSLQPVRAGAADFRLANDQVTFACQTKSGRLWPDSLKDKTMGQVVKLGTELFSLLLTNGDFIHAADFKLARFGPHRTVDGQSRRVAVCGAVAGQTTHRGTGQRRRQSPRDMAWRVARRLALSAAGIYLQRGEKGSAAERHACCWICPVGAHATGTVDGSPVMTDTAFFGVEHPLSINRGEMGYVRCFLPRGAALPAGESYCGVAGHRLRDQRPGPARFSPGLPRARTRASVPAVPALQFLV